MCLSADCSTKITIDYTKTLQDERNKEDNSSWIVTAQSPIQVDLLDRHKKTVPIYVEGPFYTWLRSIKVEYFVMRSDPLPETLEKIKIIETRDDYDDDLTNMHNAFGDPFKKSKSVFKVPTLSVHELSEGNIYAVFCTESASKSSLYNWTKFAEKKLERLKDLVVVYKVNFFATKYFE